MLDFLKLFILYWSKLINNVIVSGKQQGNSAIHIHVSNLLEKVRFLHFIKRDIFKYKK